MADMRPLLSLKIKFVWTPKINEAFKKSKQLIVDEIRNGVHGMVEQRLGGLKTNTILDTS